MRSIGGPRVVMWGSCLEGIGFPLATDQVSNGGEKMVICTILRWIRFFQYVIVLGLSRSLCGVLLLLRSMEIGSMLY